MASSSGTSSGGSSSLQLQNSGNSGSSVEDLKQVMDQRKRKRMISNRESARRSRMRKQKHLDDLTAQMGQLRNEIHQITTSVSLTTQQLLNIEAENSVLRAQVGELSHRLESLNEIITILNANHHNTNPNGNSNNNNNFGSDDHIILHHQGGPSFSSVIKTDYPASVAAESFMNPWNFLCVNQPIMASADMFPY